MKIALLPWGDVIEDFLDPLEIPLEGLRELTGGWLFGYVEALRRVDIETILLCVSARVDKPLHWRHRATGAAIHLLPAAHTYRYLRRLLVDPYA